MPNRNTRLLAMSLLVFSVFASTCAAYDAGDKTDKVYAKSLKGGVLDDSDFRNIDDFISGILEDFIHAEDHLDLASLRLSISNRSGQRFYRPIPDGNVLIFQ